MLKFQDKEVTISEDIRLRALIPLDKMLELGK